MAVFCCIEAGLLQGDSASIPTFMCHMINGQARDDSTVIEHIRGPAHFLLGQIGLQGESRH